MAVTSPAPPRLGPAPTDVLTLVAGLFLLVAGLAIAIALNDTAGGIVTDVADFTSTWPEPLRLAPAALAFVTQGVIVLFLNAWLLASRRFRLFFQMNFAVVLASLIATIATVALSSVADGLGIARNPPSILIVSVANIVAAANTLRPHVGRRMSLVLTWAVVVVATGTILSAGSPPSLGIPAVAPSLAADHLSGLVALIGVGLAGSGIAGLVFGRGTHEIPADAIRFALSRSGLDVANLETAAVDARGSRPWFADDTDGRRIFVKVLGPNQRAADLLYRGWREAKLKRSGDRAPHASLRRAVEHEALVALEAHNRGIRTPRLLATGATATGGYALAYEAVDGRTLDELDPSQLDLEVARRLWREVDWMHRGGIAHRDLRLANVLLDSNRQPWLIDFGFGELMADRELIVRDVAELLASTGAVLGAEAAVELAISVVGVEVVHEALTWLQPPTLSAATRHRLGSDRSVRRLRDEMAAAAGIDEVRPLDVERISPRHILSLLAIGVALWALAAQVSSYSDLLGILGGVDGDLVLVALGAALVGFGGGALAAASTVPQRVRFTTSLAAQFAASFVDRTRGPRLPMGRVTEWSLARCGVSRAGAAQASAVLSVTGLTIHVLLLTLALGVTYQTGALSPGQITLVGGALVAVGAAGAIVAVFPQVRERAGRRFASWFQSVHSGVIDLAEHPSRLTRLVVGSFLVTVSYVGAMLACLAAVGVAIDPAAAAVAYLVAAGLAVPSPTPGGVGVVEAFLTSAYIIIGVDPAPALAAVLLFRLATFWLPLVPGWISFVVLSRRTTSVGEPSPARSAV